MNRRSPSAADANHSPTARDRSTGARAGSSSTRTVLPSWVLVVTFCAVGCRPGTESDARTSSSKTVAPPPAVAADVSPAPDDVAVVAQDALIEVPNADQTPPLNPAPPPELPVDRLLLIAHDGPRLCDLQLTLDQVPLSAAYQADLELVLQAAQRDGHTEVSWQELCEHPDFIHGQYGNTPIENADQRRELIYRCDLNRDGRVALSELALFMAESGKGARRLILDSPPTRAAEDVTMPWFRWLDRNRDAVLSRAERDQTLTLLRQLDRNDDGALDVVEFPPEIRGMTEQDASPSTMQLVWLSEDTNWTNLLFQLEDRFAAGSPLQAGDLGVHADWFALLDADHNGQWDRSEVAGLLRLAHDYRIVIDWKDSLAGEQAVAVHVTPNRSIEGDAEGKSAAKQFPLGGVVVEVVARSEAADLSDDGLRMLGWETRDTDHDEILSSAEYATLQPVIQLPLIAVDCNQDQSVDRSELLAALTRRQLVRRCQVQVGFRRAAAPVFACWDVNQDQRLSERELAQASQRLHAFAGTAETLSRSGVPQPMELEVVRGEPLGPLATVANAGLDASPLASAPGDEPAPWFRAMDTNRDGEISRREFLGDDDQFVLGDRDGDGFWEWHEHADAATTAEPSSAD